MSNRHWALVLAVPGVTAGGWMAVKALPTSVVEAVCSPCAKAREALKAEHIVPEHAPRSFAVLARLQAVVWDPELVALATGVIDDPAAVVPEESVFGPALRREVVRLAAARIQAGLPDSDRQRLIRAMAKSLEQGTPQWRMVVMSAVAGGDVPRNEAFRAALGVVAGAEPPLVARVAVELLDRTVPAP